MGDAVARQLSPARVDARKRYHESAAAGPAGRPRGDRTESLPIDEIAANFPDRWLVVHVTVLDEHQQVSQGHLLANCSSQKKAWQAVVRAHQDDPHAQLYLFLGGTLPATVEEWRERLAEAADTL